MTYEQIIKASIACVKDENSEEWKTFDQHDWYGELESHIDGFLSENGIDESDDYEVLLERLVFDGVRKVLKRRHTCDPLA